MHTRAGLWAHPAAAACAAAGSPPACSRRLRRGGPPRGPSAASCALDARSTPDLPRSSAACAPPPASPPLPSAVSLRRASLSLPTPRACWPALTGAPARHSAPASRARKRAAATAAGPAPSCDAAGRSAPAAPARSRNAARWLATMARRAGAAAASAAAAGGGGGGGGSGARTAARSRACSACSSSLQQNLFQRRSVRVHLALCPEMPSVVHAISWPMSAPAAAGGR